MTNPLVSCVMPTANRRRFIPMAIAAWLAQTYENRELLILDDGESIADLVPRDPRIRHYYLTRHWPLGAKRNLLAELARGEIVCHWDDDDWSVPDRVADQVGRLAASGLPVTGYHSILFYEVQTRRLLRYESGIPQYAVGTSLSYRRDWWRTHQFPENADGTPENCEDNDLVYANLKQIASADGTAKIVALLHPGNTSSHHAVKAMEELSITALPLGFPLHETQLGLL